MSDRPAPVPPAPVGEPYRADPRDPAPFEYGDPAPPRSLPTLGTAPQPYQRELRAGQSPPATSFVQPRALGPDEKFARTAMRIGIASIFVFNLVLGPLAILLGASALRRGQRRTGWQAIWLGAGGTLIGVVALVLLATGVIPPLEELIEDLRRER